MAGAVEYLSRKRREERAKYTRRVDHLCVLASIAVAFWLVAEFLLMILR